MPSGKILIVTEGEKLDVSLMTRLLNTYNIAREYEIIPYKTNIHNLCRSLFADQSIDDIADIDLRLHLREHEKDYAKKEILNQKFAEILLVFDFDPQDCFYSPDWLKTMAGHFTESTDRGQLYINYPMVEAFYHMASIPDEDYPARTASLRELKAKGYKTRVKQESRNRERLFSFAANREECNHVIRQNIDKAWLAASLSPSPPKRTGRVPSQYDILNGQIGKLAGDETCFVLSTCPFYILDFDSKLIP